MHNVVLTYSTTRWDGEDSDYPIVDDGYYQPGWGELSSYKDEDCTDAWDMNEMRDRRAAATVSCEPDEFDVEDDITAIQKAVDILEEYGATQDDGWWYSSEYHTIDYSTGKDRCFCVHFHDDEWTEAEMDMIAEEILFRDVQRALMIQRHPSYLADDDNAHSYWDSVKAIV